MNGPGVRALAAALLALAILAHPSAAKRNRCPATKALPCIASPFYKNPDLSLTLGSPNIPDLTVLDVRLSADLRRILPYNDAIKLLNRKMPREVHKCLQPVLPGFKMTRFATSKRVPGWVRGAGISACKLAPFPNNINKPPYYVFGGFSNVQQLRKWDLKDLPALAAFKGNYAASLGRKLGMCVAVDPCFMNVFVGLEHVERHVSASSQGVSLAIKPNKFFYSWSVAMAPPEWRWPGSPPSFWQVAEPALPGAKGVEIPLDVLSTPQGRLFLSGVASKGQGYSLASLPSATLDLGGQAWAWVMFRDELRMAVSLRLASGPNIKLWDQFSLPFSKVKAMRDVELLTRRPTDQFWLRATNQAILASGFAKHLPPVGILLKKLYVGADKSATVFIEGVDMYGGGEKGAAMRLVFKPATLQLTPAVASVVGRGKISGNITVIITSRNPSWRFRDSLTLLHGGEEHYVSFCIKATDCDAALHSGCDASLKVCMPRSTPGKGVAASKEEKGDKQKGKNKDDEEDKQKGKNKDDEDEEKEEEKEDSKGKNPPAAVAPASGAAPQFAAGRGLVGDFCAATEHCQPPLVCGAAEGFSSKMCLEPMA